jgi:hypothetical protein
MNIVRYAIPKKDLHDLLRMLTILQPEETLHAVSSADLLDAREEMVVISVIQNASTPAPGIAHTEYSDRELQDRYVLLSLMDKALVIERDRLDILLGEVRRELARRSGTAALPGVPGMPWDVDEALTRQIRDILGRGTQPRGRE